MKLSSMYRLRRFILLLTFLKLSTTELSLPLVSQENKPGAGQDVHVDDDKASYLDVISLLLNETQLIMVTSLNANKSDSLWTEVLLFLHTQLQLPLVFLILDVKGAITSNNSLNSVSCDNCSEANVAYLILAEYEDSVWTYWNNIKQSQHLWNARANFLFLLTDTEVEGAKHYEKNASKYEVFLKNMWEFHGILNLLIITTTEVVLYDPFFHVHGNQFGRTHFYSLHDTNLGKFIKKSKLYNMAGYPFRASMFDSGTMSNSPTPYYGFDGYVLQELSRYMGFKSIIYQPEQLRDYGFHYENGTSTGSLGDVLEGRADAAFNAHFIKYYGTDDIVFTKNLLSDELCIVVPKAKLVQKWLKMLTSFNNQLYVMVFFLYLMFASLWYVFKRCRSRYESSPETRIDIVLLFLDMVHPFVNMTITALPTQAAERLLVICSLILGLILDNIFQGRLVSAIGNPSYHKDINTLEQLDKSGYLISTGSTNLLYSFAETDNPVAARLQSKIAVVEGESALERVAKRGDVAAFVRKSVADFKRFSYRASDGSKLLHLVKECPVSYSLSYVLPKTSAYLRRINEFLQRVFESGIVAHWQRKTEYDLVHQKEVVPSKVVSTHNSRKVFTLADLQLPFYILLFGLTIAKFTFVVEIFINWQKICN